MQSWIVVFLGVIALCSLVQAGFLIGLAVGGRRLARRIDALQQRIDREIRPSLDHLSQVTRNAAEISELAAAQVRRIDEVLADTVAKVEDTTEALHKLLLRPLAPIADVVAFFKGVRRGIDVYRLLRGADAERRGSSRRYADAEDEHLFI
jgi:hypothetical protein